MNKCPNCNILVDVIWLEPQDEHDFIYGVGECPMCHKIVDGMDWTRWQYEHIDDTNRPSELATITCNAKNKA